MNQGGSLQRLSRFFLSHLMRCEPTQFVIDERQQLFRGFAIPGVDRTEQLGHVAGHRSNLSRARAGDHREMANERSSDIIVCGGDHVSLVASLADWRCRWSVTAIRIGVVGKSSASLFPLATRPPFALHLWATPIAPKDNPHGTKRQFTVNRLRRMMHCIPKVY